MHDSALSGSIQSVKWEWQSNRNPWSTAEAQRWTPYSKEDTLLLEKGFEEKKMVIQIGNCDVRLDSWIQIHRQDVWKVSPVRRVEMTGRAPYFCSELSTAKTFNMVNYTGNPPIIEKWKKDKILPFQINEDGYNMTADEDMSRLKEIVELACRGILREGHKGNWEPFAESIAKRLRDSINKNPEGIFRECIYAYTEQNNNVPVSLYSVINKALKEDNSDKIDTLGPFCYLLQFTLKNLSVPESEYFYTGQAYRGLVLDNNVLELYKKAWKKGSLISFQCFVSTSKDINIVKKFQSIRNTERKVLLNIKVLGGVYIESLASQHGEEEVLLPASSAFKILDIKEGETTTIFLEMINAELNSVELSNEKIILMSDSSLSQLRCSLSEWSRGKDIYFEINRHGENITPLDKAESLEKLVIQAAEGIRNCGSKLGKKSEKEGIRIAQDLLNTINRAPLEIFRVALKWYTHENFLSREIGKYLNHKEPKLLKDLGAYMHLLNIYFVGIEKIIKIYQKPNQADLDTVYYSIPMSISQIAIFEELYLKKLQFAFPSFVWTSSNRELAECDIQSNQSQDKRVSVLYNIIIPKEMISLFNMRKHSVFPDEDDVLLPPNFNFKVVEIQKDPRNNMIEISLKFIEYVL